MFDFDIQESWDYIGSSRMAYDMSHGEAFPENDVRTCMNILYKMYIY